MIFLIYLSLIFCTIQHNYRTFHKSFSNVGYSPLRGALTLAWAKVPFLLLGDKHFFSVVPHLGFMCFIHPLDARTFLAPRTKCFTPRQRVVLCALKWALLPTSLFYLFFEYLLIRGALPRASSFCSTFRTTTLLVVGRVVVVRPNGTPLLTPGCKHFCSVRCEHFLVIPRSNIICLPLVQVFLEVWGMHPKNQTSMICCSSHAWASLFALWARCCLSLQVAGTCCSQRCKHSLFVLQDLITLFCIMG